MPKSVMLKKIMETGRWIKEIFRRARNRRILEYAVPVILLCAGLITYLIVSRQREGVRSPVSDFRDRTFINALYHYRLENFDRAELLFKRSLESSRSQKKKSSALLFLGNIYYKREAYERALEYYEDAVSHDKRNLSALHNLSLTLMRLEREDDALRNAEKLYGMGEKLPENLLLLGNMRFATGRYDDAAGIYSEESGSFTAGSDEKTAASQALFRYNRAMASLRVDDTSLASGLFETILELEKTPDLIKGLSAYRLGTIYEGSDTDK